MRRSVARAPRATARRLAGMVTLLVLAPAPRSRAAEPSVPPSAASATAAATRPAPLTPGDIMVGNRKVTTLRGVLCQVPPHERARVANERIEAALEAGGSLTVAVRTEAEGRLFTIGDRGVCGLTPGDLDPAAGETLDHAAAVTAERLETAIRETREQRSLPALLKALGRSVVATAVLALVLVGFEKDRLYWATTRLLLLLTRAVDLLALYLWTTFVLPGRARPVDPDVPPALAGARRPPREARGGGESEARAPARGRLRR